MRPPVRWFGSKTMLAPKIIDLMPPHRHYVEVFSGSAAVLFAKSRSPLETVNDLDDRIVNLFSVLRDPDAAAELERQVWLTPYGRAEFNAAKSSDSTDPIERARCFLVTAIQAVGNAGEGWSYTANESAVSAARSHRWTSLPTRLQACAERLRGVQVDSVDWRLVLQRYDKPGVLLFVDPPYHPEVRPNTMGSYRHEFTAADHDELVAALADLRHAKAMVTHYPHPLYDSLEWEYIDLSAAADNATAKRQDARVERIYISHPQNSQGRLFG